MRREREIGGWLVHEFNKRGDLGAIEGWVIDFFLTQLKAPKALQATRKQLRHSLTAPLEPV